MHELVQKVIPETSQNLMIVHVLAEMTHMFTALLKNIYLNL